MTSIMIVAGEHSGDLHGARVAGPLLEARPDVKMWGVGGEKMREAGVEVLYDFTEHAAIGPLAAAAEIKGYLSVFRQLISEMRARKPDLVVLVDFPEFNIRLAHRCRDEGIPIVYYISPQVWAWRQGRRKTLKKLVERMVVIFEFEKQFYDEVDLDTVWVGHPLMDALADIPDREACRAELGILNDQRVIGILPGSRGKEVERLLGVSLGAAKKIKQQLPDIEFAVACAPGIDPKILRSRAEEIGVQVRVVEGKTHELMRACDFLICKSGTSTIEAAILDTPMVVIYKVNPIEAMIVRALVRVDNYAMVNIVAGKTIMPELLQKDANPEKIAEAVIAQFERGLDTMKDELAGVRAKLGAPGSARRAADAVLEVLDKVTSVPS